MGMSVFNQRPAKTVSKDPGMVVEGGLFGGPGRKNSYYGQGEQEADGSGKDPHDSSSHDSSLNAQKFFNRDDVENMNGDEYSTGEELPPLSPDWDEPI
ncbi:hypothetical protein HOG98_07860 [bacterium]|jgi:hypothetical protein|nr:hypothetical protein [bacterium]